MFLQNDVFLFQFFFENFIKDYILLTSFLLFPSSSSLQPLGFETYTCIIIVIVIIYYDLYILESVFNVDYLALHNSSVELVPGYN